MNSNFKTIMFSLTAGLTLSLSAQAAEVNLRFAHFWPATSGISQELESWGKNIEEKSAGRIHVEMYPSQMLAKAPKVYDSVVTGVADVGASIQGYTANRFPRSQLVELPGIVATGQQGSCIIQNLYQEGMFDKEYDDAHVLFMFTHGSGHIHTKDKAIKTPADLDGVMIRRPTVVAGELLKGLGAEPVGLAAPEMYGAMSRGVINGVTLPWEAMTSFRLNELADKHTQIGLYSLAFVVTMNNRVYDSMPDDLKQIVNDNSGIEWALKLGAAYDRLDKKGLQQAKDMGHEITVIEGGVQNPEWKPMIDTAVNTYTQSLKEQGINADPIINRAKALSETCNQQVVIK